MKKNFIVIASVGLILLMTLSIVSAGWFTGHATVKVGDSVKKYLRRGKVFTFRFDGEDREYALFVKYFKNKEVNFRIGTEETGFLKKGESYTFSNYPVKITVEKVIGSRFVKVKIERVMRAEKAASSSWRRSHSVKSLTSAAGVHFSTTVSFEEGAITKTISKHRRRYIGNYWDCIEYSYDEEAGWSHKTSRKAETTGINKEIASGLGCEYDTARTGEFCYWDPDVCGVGGWAVGTWRDLESGKVVLSTDLYDEESSGDDPAYITMVRLSTFVDGETRNDGTKVLLPGNSDIRRNGVMSSIENIAYYLRKPNK